MDKATKSKLINPLSRVRHAAFNLAKLQLDVAKDVALEFIDEYGKVAYAAQQGCDLPLEAAQNVRDAAHELRTRLRRLRESLEEICQSLDYADEKMGDDYVERLALAFQN